MVREERVEILEQTRKEGKEQKGARQGSEILFPAMYSLIICSGSDMWTCDHEL